MPITLYAVTMMLYATPVSLDATLSLFRCDADAAAVSHITLRILRYYFTRLLPRHYAASAIIATYADTLSTLPYILPRVLMPLRLAILRQATTKALYQLLRVTR